MRILLSLMRAIAAIIIVGSALPAVLALFGFAVPLFDIFNHLQVPLFFGTLAALLLSVVLRMSWWRAVAVIGFAASAFTFVPEWASGLMPRQAVPEAATVKVMTHNIFGLNDDMERVDAVIRAEDPDIVALQEYFPEQAALDRLLRERYPYSVRCQGGKRANLGLYSRLPFEETMTAGDCPANARGDQRTAHITGRFTLSDGTVFSVMTTHMDWPYPVERQHEQFVATAEAIRAIEGPVLVVGDFNSTPWSYALRGFESMAGLRRETRNLPTYPELFTLPRGLVRTGSFLPIDHVFQRGMVVSELRPGPLTGSDHLPVVAIFSVAAGG